MLNDLQPIVQSKNLALIFLARFLRVLENSLGIVLKTLLSSNLKPLTLRSLYFTESEQNFGRHLPSLVWKSKFGTSASQQLHFEAHEQRCTVTRGRSGRRVCPPGIHLGTEPLLAASASPDLRSRLFAQFNFKALSRLGAFKYTLTTPLTRTDCVLYRRAKIGSIT